MNDIISGNLSGLTRQVPWMGNTGAPAGTASSISASASNQKAFISFLFSNLLKCKFTGFLFPNLLRFKFTVEDVLKQQAYILLVGVYVDTNVLESSLATQEYIRSLQGIRVICPSIYFLELSQGNDPLKKNLGLKKSVISNTSLLHLQYPEIGAN